jgi:branched-chain amino acid transport system ATP-binding protein
VLSVSHLNVWYGITEVLRDVSFDVPRNTIVALLGGNGSGKTTILNTLTGLLRPRGGSIRFGDRETVGLPVHDVVKLGMAQVPQGREVFPTMTVDENLELGAATRSNRRQIADDVADIYEMFPALAERRNRKAGALSGGEQQQLAIGRALMCRPQVLLMDEPSAGLAPIIVEKMVETIRMLRDRGLTILLVEQNVGVAAAVAESAHVLQNGEIVHSGSATELISSQQILASYLGR